MTYNESDKDGIANKLGILKLELTTNQGVWPFPSKL